MRGESKRFEANRTKRAEPKRGDSIRAEASRSDPIRDEAKRSVFQTQGNTMTKQHTQPAPEANDDDLEPTSGMATALVRAFKSPIGHGTFIPPEVIEKVLTIKRDCEGYSLGIVGLRKLLEAHIEATTGMLLMTRQSEAGIRFLTPQEAVKHGHATVAARFDAAHRWHLKTQVCVEPYLEDLTNQEREVYRQEQHANARILLHAKEIRRSRAEESAIGDSDD